MNRENIIIIICIGIVVLFYCFQENTIPVEPEGLVQDPTIQSSDDVTIKTLKQMQKEVYDTIPDSLANKENQGN